MEEEVVLLEEQLATAHADVVRLEARLAEAEGGNSGREAEASELRTQVEALQAEAAERSSHFEALQVQVQDLETQLIEAQTQSHNDATRYRELVLAHEPDLPANLVAGGTIAAVDEARLRARETVAQVRQHLEQQAVAHRVPAGAPVRAAPDLSGLSSAEKIRLGLQQS